MKRSESVVVFKCTTQQYSLDWRDADFESQEPSVVHCQYKRLQRGLVLIILV